MLKIRKMAKIKKFNYQNYHYLTYLQEKILGRTQLKKEIDNKKMSSYRTFISIGLNHFICVLEISLHMIRYTANKTIEVSQMRHTCMKKDTLRGRKCATLGLNKCSGNTIFCVEHRFYALPSRFRQQIFER